MTSALTPIRFGSARKAATSLRVAGSFHEGGARSMRAREPLQQLAVVARPALANRQKLLDGMAQDVGAEMQDHAHAALDRDRVPGPADAEGVHLPVGKAVDHI